MYVFESIVVDEATEAKSHKRLLRKIKSHRRSIFNKYYYIVMRLEHQNLLEIIQDPEAIRLEKKGEPIVYVGIATSMPQAIDFITQLVQLFLIKSPSLDKKNVIQELKWYEI